MTDNFQDDDTVQNDDERYKRQSETEPQEETKDEDKEVSLAIYPKQIMAFAKLVT